MATRDEVRRAVLYAQTEAEVREAIDLLRTYVSEHPEDEDITLEGESLAMTAKALQIETGD